VDILACLKQIPDKGRQRMLDAIAVGIVVLIALGLAIRWFYRQAAGRRTGCPTCGSDCPTCCQGPSGTTRDLRPGEDTEPRA
jgi:hypothetical protein